MQRSDIRALLIALAVTLAMGWFLVYFVNNLWPRLPPWLSMLVFIFLAVVVIGYPILELARWSNRYVERQQQRRTPVARNKPDRRP
jgi:high-affinity Fe2+/Pb2+ permease